MAEMRHTSLYFVGVIDESMELSTPHVVQEQTINVTKYYTGNY
jgi:hypothetical protein